MKWVRILLFLFIFAYVQYCEDAFAQQTFIRHDFSLLENRMDDYAALQYAQQDTTQESDELPSPRSVLFKSLIIPGWGQIVNRQIWKVPIIYGMFAGIGVYTIYLDGQYKDYRAAYYNTTHSEDNDFRFGPTPERLEGVNANQLQSTRNSLRNRRDFMFVVLGLAYGLNALDAYIFAHMRGFDVSDDLSANATLQPTLISGGNPGPGIRITVSLFNK